MITTRISVRRGLMAIILPSTKPLTRSRTTTRCTTSTLIRFSILPLIRVGVLPRVLYSPVPHVDLIMCSCTLYVGHLSAPDLHQSLQFHNLSLMSTHQYPPPPVYTSSPQHVSMGLPAGSPPPPSPHMYDPLSPPISGSDTSADGIYHHSRNSSGTGSPSSSRGASLVHRTSLRYNPTPSPTTSSSGRRGRGRSLNDSDDEDMGATFVENLAHSRKEATRRQRIEAEQRRRDELRDGYAKLKDVLPVSNQKSSKVSLLERGNPHRW